MAQSKITFKVITFEGDPALVDFFFNQVRTLAKIHKWKDEETIQFLGSKLSGAALTFFTQNPAVFKSTDLNFVEKEFRAFFAPISKTAALVEFNNLILLPQESIRNFAHRLNVLTPKVYTEIKDEQAIDNIKFTKFVSSIPSNLRVKIQEEQITDYKKAIERAQILQDIVQNEKILQASSSTTIDSIENKLHELTEKINTISFTSKQNDSKEHKSSHTHYSPDRNKNRQYKNRYSGSKRYQSGHFQSKNSNTTVCQLCSKSGHVAKNCFKWKRANFKTNENKQFRKDRYDKDQEKHLN